MVVGAAAIPCLPQRGNPDSRAVGRHRRWSPSVDSPATNKRSPFLSVSWLLTFQRAAGLTQLTTMPHRGTTVATADRTVNDFFRLELTMIRLIKRYGSRKLYDTEESRYVALDELAGWIRNGQQIKVIDNKTSDDVTAQTLTQIISEEGRKGTSLLPNEVLHELIRAGEKAVSNGVEQLQNRMDRLVQASMDRIGPVRRAREEMGLLRERLEELEVSLAAFEGERRVSAPKTDDE
jgi:polyhydroxyalkanoate synthesis repressor PhaR